MSLLKPTQRLHPIYIGPIMIHLKKDKNSYLHFAKSIQNYYENNKESFKGIGSLYDVKRIITDDDKGLHGAFKTVFTRSQFMLCCNHLQKNIEQNLGRFNDAEIHQPQILKSIFGSQDDRTGALINCKTKEEYEKMLEPLLLQWEKISTKSEASSFATYFLKYKKTQIYENVILPAQNYNIDHFYTTNDVESMNKAIKAIKLNKTKYTFTNIHLFFEQIARAQTNNATNAMIGTGDFILAPEFRKFNVSNDNWVNSSQEKRLKHINKFLNATIEQIRKTGKEKTLKTIIKNTKTKVRKNRTKNGKEIKTPNFEDFDDPEEEALMAQFRKHKIQNKNY